MPVAGLPVQHNTWWAGRCCSSLGGGIRLGHSLPCGLPAACLSSQALQRSQLAAHGAAVLISWQPAAPSVALHGSIAPTALLYPLPGCSLVINIAKRYTNSGVPLADLIPGAPCCWPSACLCCRSQPCCQRSCAAIPAPLPLGPALACHGRDLPGSLAPVPCELNCTQHGILWSTLTAPHHSRPTASCLSRRGHGGAVQVARPL